MVNGTATESVSLRTIPTVFFGAAATFSPGGAMQNSGGLYFESSNNAYLGGNLKFQGCGTRLEAFYDQALPQGAAKRTEAGRLKR